MSAKSIAITETLGWGSSRSVQYTDKCKKMGLGPAEESVPRRTGTRVLDISGYADDTGYDTRVFQSELALKSRSLRMPSRKQCGRAWAHPITLGHTEHSSQKNRVQTGGYQVLLPSITVSPLCPLGSEDIFGS